MANGITSCRSCKRNSSFARKRHRYSILLVSAAAVIFVAISISSVADTTDGKTVRTGWYLSGGLGIAWGTDMKQDGWNRDTFCYPDAACFDEDPIPNVSGFNWLYDVDLEGGTAFEFSVGRFFGRSRLELAVAQHINETSQVFTGITYLDGSAIRPRLNGTVDSNGRGAIDQRRIRSIVLDGYFDFPDVWQSITPYIGVGFGQASVNIMGVQYSTEYQDAPTSLEEYDPPLSFYDSVQDADLDDTAFLWRIHVGADYLLNPLSTVGLRLSWSASEEIEASGGYETHPMHDTEPDFMNTTVFNDVSNWTLMLSFRRVIGN